MASKPSSTARPLAFSYLRFSSVGQAKGDSLRRQEELREGWLKKHPEVIFDQRTTLADHGVSAFAGDHRSNPDRHALASFLDLVRQGRIPRGSYLIVENLDRLSREDAWPAVELMSGLVNAGILVVQLSPVEHVFTATDNPMAVMMAIMELSRGNSESRIKSERVGKAWRNLKAKAAREKVPITKMTPAWLRIRDGKFEVIDAAAAAVRLIYQLAIDGHGISVITRRLIADKVPAFGRTGRWSRATVAKILLSRKVVGEYQPLCWSKMDKKRIDPPADGKEPKKELRGSVLVTKRKKNPRHRDDGPPIAGYYPAVITAEQWDAARGAIENRTTRVGRVGNTVNLFGGLLHDARDGAPIYQADKGVRVKVRPGKGGKKAGQGKGRAKAGEKRGGVKLVNAWAMEGRAGAKYVSFPLDVFEKAILSRLAEINPADLVSGYNPGDEVPPLEGKVSDVEKRIKRIQDQMVDGDDDIKPLMAVLRKLEVERQAAADALALAREKAANPVGAAWDQCQSIARTLDAAKDVSDTRTRLRSALRRIVRDIRCLFIEKGMSRIAVVQIWFESGHHRDYMILYTAPHMRSGHPAKWWVRSFVSPAGSGEFDLRTPGAAGELEALLGALDVRSLVADGL
jgi:DNA invertase Pin-like site-specific DNA recombinase